MIWDKKVIQAVTREYQKVQIDKDHLAEVVPLNVMTTVAETLLEAIQKIHKVTVRIQDMQFEVSDLIDYHQTEYKCYWLPETKEVEFYGGHVDGKIAQVMRLDPVLFALEDDEPLGYKSEHPSAQAFQIRKVQYVLSGWDDKNNRWVYRPV